MKRSEYLLSSYVGPTPTNYHITLRMIKNSLSRIFNARSGGEQTKEDPESKKAPHFP
jgi:hypothetical protein